MLRPGHKLRMECPANNENELLKKIAQHAEQHGFTEIPFEWEAKIKAAVKDV